MTDLQSTDDLYCNDATAIYIRLNGVYYVRVVGRGWLATNADALPGGLNFCPMVDAQKTAYMGALRDSGLL